MINAAVASAMASATINAAQATASGSGTRASCQLHPSSVPPCLCESLNKWCCPLHCDYDEKDYFACEKVLDKIHFYDGIEKLNSLGRSSVLNVLSSGKVVLTQTRFFSWGAQKCQKFIRWLETSPCRPRSWKHMLASTLRGRTSSDWSGILP